MANTQPIFKFVSVRGVETSKNQNSKSRFIHYRDQVRHDSDFVTMLRSANEKDRPALCESRLEDHTDEWRNHIVELFAIWQGLNDQLQTARPGASRIAEIADDFNKTIHLMDDALDDSFINDTWDQFIAATITRTSRFGDLSQLVNSIRIVNIRQHSVEVFEDARSLESFLNATPVVDRLFYSRQKKKPDETDSADGNKKPVKDPLADKVATLKSALNELFKREREHRRLLAKRESKPKAKPAPDKTGKRMGESQQDRKESGIDAFVFLPAVARTVSASTLKVMEEHGLTINDRISHINDTLESAQQYAIANASRGLGLRRIVQYSGGLSVFGTHPGIRRPAPGPPADQPGVPSSVGSVKPVGVGDLLIVEENLLKYESHEIAHVENILQSEFKERVHRKLERHEQSFLFESESTAETEEDLQTAERYELQKESETIIQLDLQAAAGVSVSAGYGPVSASVSANSSISASFQHSVSKATSYARDVTRRSVSKIIERQQEQSSSRSLKEIEETNSHGFDNKTGSGHVIGIYRFLNKVYRAQVYNYGRRLMFEFLIPEPAAIYKYLLTNQKLPGMTVAMPDDEILDLSPADITRANYLALVQLYQAAGVSAPPPRDIYVAKAFYADYNQETRFTGTANNDLQIPDGYHADSFNIDRVYGTRDEDGVKRFEMIVGDRYSNLREDDQVGRNLSELTSTVPVVIKTSRLTNWGASLEVKCRLSAEKYQEWQMDTYSALLDAYNNLKSIYQEQLNAAKSDAGVGVFGQSDEMNRRTEQRELKRGCLTLLTDQQFDLFDAVDFSGDMPAIDVKEALAEGAYAQFFEQTFEWEQMTYVFYPYFWGNKSNWVENANIQNRDTKFQEFLSAGYVRVLIPVRPGYDNAILHFLESGEIWQGGELPAINDELYLSILDDVYGYHEMDERVPVGDPWLLNVPTNLVYLQPDSALPVFDNDQP